MKTHSDRSSLWSRVMMDKVIINHVFAVKIICFHHFSILWWWKNSHLPAWKGRICLSFIVIIIATCQFKVKVMDKVKPVGHIWGLGVQSICLLFVSWQSDHFWLKYSKFYIWPWKCKVKVMAKVKPNGHIWALEFNPYVCLLFGGNRIIFGWDIANSIFHLEKPRSRSWRKSTKI